MLRQIVFVLLLLHFLLPLGHRLSHEEPKKAVVTHVRRLLDNLWNGQRGHRAARRQDSKSHHLRHWNIDLLQARPWNASSRGRCSCLSRPPRASPPPASPTVLRCGGGPLRSASRRSSAHVAATSGAVALFERQHGQTVTVKEKRSGEVVVCGVVM